MSSYLCSNETLSVVADIVSENFEVDPIIAFKELLEYNYENLKNLYDEKGYYPREYHRLIDITEAQKIQSINNYLYQTVDTVNCYVLDWLTEYADKKKHLIDNASEKLYWDLEDKYIIEEPKDNGRALYDKYNGDIKEIAKEIRKDLKAVFGKSIKFSVRCSYFSMGMDDKHCYNLEEYLEAYSEPYDTEYDKQERLELFNKCKIVKSSVIKRIEAIHRKYNYHESDPYTDYYDCGYYGEPVHNLIKR